MRAISIPIHIVFYREGEYWIAHCLQLDLLGSGETHEEAMDTLFEAIRLQVEASIEFNNPRNLFRPAEGKYWQMFAKGSPRAVGDMTIEVKTVTVGGVTAREYEDKEEEDLVCV